MPYLLNIVRNYGSREDCAERCLKRRTAWSEATANSAFCVFQRKKRKLSRRIADCNTSMMDESSSAAQQSSSSCSRYDPDHVDHLSFNRRIVFVKRPGENNFPTADCFHWEECPAPNQSDVGDGQCIVRTLFLSVDPAQRCRMNRSTGVDYLEPFEPGELVDGLEGIGVVEMASVRCNFNVGDLVTSVGRLWPWSRLFVADHSDLVKVNLPPDYSPSIILSCVGISGMTALLGIRKKAAIDRSRPQTIVVSGAAGSCGSLAGQIARLDGCTKVIGICGSSEKCEVLLNELGFDGAINYKAESVPDRLRYLAPEGIDIYFDNVGGFVSDAVIAQMNRGGRVVLCGQIAVYNTSLPYPPPLPEKTAEIIAERRIKRERYNVLSYKDDLDSTVAQLSAWLQEKKLKVKETIYEGLERAPEAFVDMMNGKNIGKMMVKVN
uniref:Prostaglandin reductase 2 n=2 Tax=Ascarididae TaxID=6250 RepID=A0A915BCY8_PARUN